MKNLEHQTKQAFLFSLAFYGIAVLSFLFKLGIFPVLVSLSFILSLLWIILVLREIMLSTKISNSERFLIALVTIVFNVVGGCFYFYFWREKVLGTIKK